MAEEMVAEARQNEKRNESKGIKKELPIKR